MKTIAVLMLLVLLAGCSARQARIANPASEFCIGHGFENYILTAADGSQAGYCKVKAGETVVECDEWAYFRGECPAENISAEPEESAAEQNKTIETAAEPAAADTAAEAIAEEKLLLYFPWPNGKSWTLTTNFHDENALDFASFEKTKAPVLAAADGEVFFAHYAYPNSFNTYSSKKTYSMEDMGNFAILDHGGNTYTVYFHLQNEASPPVKAGNRITAGTRIGYEGNTGWSHGNHLHFAVVDVALFPVPALTEKPLDSWGFRELGGSNLLVLNRKYMSQNPGAY